MLYNGEVRQTMGKPARGGQGLSNNGDVQGWTEEPQNRGSAGISSLDRVGWGYPHGNACDPEVVEIRGECQVSHKLSCCLPPRSKVQGGQGGCSPRCSEQQRSAPAVPFSKGKQRLPGEVGSSTRGRKKGAFQQSPPACKAGEREAGDEPGVRADSSARRFPKAVRLISCRFPHGHLRSVPHTSLDFSNFWCPSSPPGNQRGAVINDPQAVYYTH